MRECETRFVSSFGKTCHAHLLPSYRSPDSAKVKSKMLYASSKDAIRKKLVGVANEIQATDAAEVSYDTVLDRVHSHSTHLIVQIIG